MAKIIWNTFYIAEPKYISLTHPYISQCRRTSQFLIQIVAPETYEDITSYSSFLFPIGGKSISFSPSLYDKFPRHPVSSGLSCSPHPLFWNHSASVTFTWLCKCAVQINHLGSQMPRGDDRTRTDPSSADSQVPGVEELQISWWEKGLKHTRIA